MATKFLKGTAKYKANVDGELTLEQQITLADADSLYGEVTTNKKFEEALRYDITRTVVNILGNAVIKYDGMTNLFCMSLQRELANIYFEVYKHGSCYVHISESRSVTGVSQTKQAGSVYILDKAYDISGYTQYNAVKRSLEMYEVVTNTMFSVLDERGMLGMFSPQKDTIIKPSQAQKIAESFRTLFGGKQGQKKFGVVEVPMTYSGVTIPIKDMELLENKKDATATTARLFGIQEDMILSGSTFDNKENAIVQTYTDYKGLIYDYINQIESAFISVERSVSKYDVTFPSVPQLNKSDIETNG